MKNLFRAFACTFLLLLGVGLRANEAPVVNLIVDSPTHIFGETITIALVVTDADSNLHFSYIAAQNGSGPWTQDPNVSFAPWFAGVFQPSTEFVASGDPSCYSAIGLATITKWTLFRPANAGNFQFSSNACDGVVWAGDNAAVWSAGNWFKQVIVGKATPVGTFAASTFAGARVLTAADLNATFANPYSTVVAVPTGAKTYSVFSASGTGASPTSGVVSVGTTLQPGTYTIRASYAGDGNYNPATIDASFTVSIIDADGDGMPNDWETANGLNPNVADALSDPDGDGLSNIAEYNLSGGVLNSTKYRATGYDQSTSTIGGAIPAGWTSLAADGDSTKAVGATAGELNVDKSGGLNYSVPIWTTPGTAGMEPKVSLNYSSQAGAGIAGFGWSVSGVSAISRGGQTKVIDGQNLGTTLSGTDRFYLDGQRLILVSGTYGSPNSEYRTEIDSFTKVIAYGSAGSGPLYFKAWTKAGLLIEFGNTTDSARTGVRPDSSSPSEKIAWGVNKISDTKGNYMNFVYVQDSTAGTQVLDRINYTGNSSVLPYASLRFTYESRPDSSSGYALGCTMASLQRLTTIKSYFGETIAHTYTLGYTNINNTPTNRSLLTSLTETGTDNKSYPPLTFAYEAPTGGWQSSFSSQPFVVAEKGKATGAGIMDLNGDGYADFIRRKNSATNTILYDDAYLSKPWAGYMSPLDPIWSPSPMQPNPDRPIMDYRMTSFVGANGGFTLAWDGRTDSGTRIVDLNGDGLPDLIYADRQSTGTIFTSAYRNTGTGWADYTWNANLPSTGSGYISGYNKADAGRRFIDVNGDGLPDLVWNSDNPTESGCLINNINRQYQASGPNWVDAPQWAPPLLISGKATAGSFFFDVNGDGLVDQVQFGCGNPIEVGVALNSPTGWVTSAKGTFSLYGSTYSTIKNSTALGTLGKYLPPVFLSRQGDSGSYSSKPIGTELVDLNGDGLLDVIFNNPAIESGIDASLKTAKAALNTGNGWVDAPQYYTTVALVGNVATSKTEATGAVLADLNGDGLPDLAVSKENQTPVYYLNTGHGWSPPNNYYAPANYTLPGLIANADTTVPTGAQLVDLNGDGIADFVSNYGNVQINKAKPSCDKLIKVTNGLGVSAAVSYALLTERDSTGRSTVYTKGSGATYPVADITGPMLVVKTVNNDDGVGGQYPVSYTYKNLRSDALRGSLGFEKMIVTDGRTNIVSETTFAQVYPFVGMPLTSTTKTTSVTLLSSSVVTYAEKALNSGKTRFVFATNSLSTTWDLNTTKTSETYTGISANDIDNYGNILSITVSSTALPSTTTFFTKVTTSSYVNDDVNWVLGRLQNASVNSTSPTDPTGITRTSSFTCYPVNGLLNTETVQPGDAAQTLTTTYSYDSFGNKTSASSSGYHMTVDGNGNYSAVGIDTRTTSTIYDASGRFVSVAPGASDIPS